MQPRRILLLLLCLLPLWAAAQFRDGVYHLSVSSLPQDITEPCWRIFRADLLNGADTSLDDSHWPFSTSQRLRVKKSDSTARDFEGIAWLRLHIIVDSSILDQPIALRLSHNGASEVYLDGRLLRRYGRLFPKDSAEYINPQRRPLHLPTLSAGHHVIALRYADWIYRDVQTQSGSRQPGFRMSIWTAVAAENNFYEQLAASLFSFVLLFGIFVTLCIVHFILFLYYRAERANGLFSLFALCVALLFLFPAIMRLSEDALLLRQLGNAELILVAAIGISLSLLLNHLFSKRRWHFYIVMAACAALVLCTLLLRTYTVFAMVAVVVLVPLEALYILSSALWHRMPGARIVGGGFALFILLMLCVMIAVFIGGDIEISDTTLWGQIFMLVLVLAILSIPISMSMYLAWRFAHVSHSLKAELARVEALSIRTREQEAEKQRLLENRREELEKEVAERTASLRLEKQKSEDLLLNILPAEVAEELKEKGHADARLYNNVTVLFTDFVNFTQRSERLKPSELVALIDYYFKAFDTIIELHGLEKIKTIGDAYLAVCGLPAENPDHACNVVAAALEIRDFMEAQKASNPAAFQIRIGINSGPVVAGIVGVKKFAYDIWGDTVNTAARMEQHGEVGKVNISAATYELVKDSFQCSFRGELEAKHKGRMGMYFVEA